MPGVFGNPVAASIGRSGAASGIFLNPERLVWKTPGKSADTCPVNFFPLGTSRAL